MRSPTIGINDFVRRQTADSEFTHFEGSWEQLVELVAENFDNAQPGYRNGVCLVPVPAEGFYCGVVELKEGDRLEGAYKPRRPGEEPRKTIRVCRPRDRSGKSACTHVDIVLYSRETLEGNDEDCTGKDWDVIALNGRMTETEMPIHPDTLIANHFELDGGTPTKMSPEEFEKALRESVLFWKNRAILLARNS